MPAIAPVLVIAYQGVTKPGPQALGPGTQIVDPRAWALLNQVKDRLHTIKTLSAVHHYTLNTTGGAGKIQWLSEVTHVRLKRPNLCLVKSSMSWLERGKSKPEVFASWETTASDGKTGWRLDSKQQYSTWKAPPSGVPFALKFVDVLQGFDSPDDFVTTRISLLKREGALTGLHLLGPRVWQGSPYQVIAMDSSMLGDPSHEEFYVGRNNLIDRYTIQGEHAGKRRSYESWLSDVEIDQPMSNASFAFRLPNSAQPDGTEQTSVRASIPVGSLAPDFEAMDRSGHLVRLSSYRSKVVVLDFWATWCGNCLSEFPRFSSLANRYSQKGVVVLALNVGDTAPVFKTWLSRNPKYGPIMFLIDPLGVKGKGISALYKAGLPTTYVIDASGKVAASFSGLGPRTDDDIQAAVEAAISSSPVATGSR